MMRGIRVAPLGLNILAGRLPRALPRALPWADIGLALWAGTQERHADAANSDLEISCQRRRNIL
jgi:hypothetical protein